MKYYMQFLLYFWEAKYKFEKVAINRSRCELDIKSFQGELQYSIVIYLENIQTNHSRCELYIKSNCIRLLGMWKRLQRIILSVNRLRLYQRNCWFHVPLLIFPYYVSRAMHLTWLNKRKVSWRQPTLAFRRHKIGLYSANQRNMADYNRYKTRDLGKRRRVRTKMAALFIKNVISL